MKTKNKLLILVLSGLTFIPANVNADMTILPRPFEYLLLTIPILIVIGLIVGAVFLIRWIIKKIKEKNK